MREVSDALIGDEGIALAISDEQSKADDTSQLADFRPGLRTRRTT